MLKVYIDGLAEPTNPGTGTFGFVIYSDGQRVLRRYGLVGRQVTNNVSEYEALLQALTELLPRSDEDIIVFSDSRLLVNQMTGKWKAKKGAYYQRFLEAKQLSSRFRSLKFNWIPREQNREADHLSRIAYQELRG
jgi:ribonuclease HI